jgi:hypothetical protein
VRHAQAGQSQHPHSRPIMAPPHTAYTHHLHFYLPFPLSANRLFLLPHCCSAPFVPFGVSLLLLHSHSQLAMPPLSSFLPLSREFPAPCSCSTISPGALCSLVGRRTWELGQFALRRGRRSPPSGNQSRRPAKRGRNLDCRANLTAIAFACIVREEAARAVATSARRALYTAVAGRSASASSNAPSPSRPQAQPQQRPLRRRRRTCAGCAGSSSTPPRGSRLPPLPLLPRAPEEEEPGRTRGGGAGPGQACANAFSGRRSSTRWVDAAGRAGRDRPLWSQSWTRVLVAAGQRVVWPGGV